jgi:hypothetical protein
MNKRLAVVLVALALVTLNAAAQRTTGSISGQVIDPQDAAVAGAKVVISNEATGFKLELMTSPEGFFSAPDLLPANYKVTITGSGFKTYETVVTVRVGVTTPVNAKLELGAAATVVTVESSAVSVDTTKATVQGVVTGERIDSLPLNGRNFLDLAQQEPGVQLVDGGTFDPTKNQFVGVSIGGRSGRVTRIQVDGVDITDETVGTTVANISNESIQEFGISQSSLDPSTDVTSSGAVNIITKSGSNTLHGSGAFFFRNQDLGADQRLNKAVPTTEKPPFDREIVAARAGGPFIKDRLFWHVEYEYNNQDAQRFTNIPEFPQFTGAFGVPLDERMTSGRADWTLTNQWSLFYRFAHNYNFGVTGFGGRDLASFANLNNTNFHVMGADYRGSTWTHSLRYAYLNFNNFIVDANSAAGTPATLDPAGNPLLVRILGVLQDVGPDLLAPQNTFQDNKQTKYDANWVRGKHTFTFGAEYNHIEQFVFASFFGLAPRIRASRNATTRAFANTNPFSPQGELDPLNYPLNQVVLGNGLGFFSEKSALGFPFGGTTNHRLAFYGGDSWKISTNFTLNYAVRYTWHSALSNQDLERTPTINLFDPALGGRPRRDSDDFGPQVGFAWNLFGDAKTVIRGGAGIFYETNIFNNLLFDRVINIPPGIGNDTPVLTAGSPNVIDPATGAVLFDFSTQCTTITTPTPNSCFGAALGQVIPFVQQAQQLLQASSAALSAGWPQPGVPPLFDQILSTAGSAIDPNYDTAYGIQMNIGFQRELKSGLVLAVDYTRNRGVHFNQIWDRNRLGAADTLHIPTAVAAIVATHTSFGCPADTLSTSVDCAITAGATIGDYASNGLGSGSGVDGFAFSGQNRNFRDMGVISTSGVSLYQGLQVRLNGRLGTWWAFKNAHTNITYSLSRFQSSGGDQDFLSGSALNDRPTKFYGPAGLDRTSQLGVSFIFDLPWNFRVSTSNSFRSPLAGSIFLPLTTGGADEIFYSDLDGDGTIEDPFPGTLRGAFSRSRSSSEMQNLITQFNSNVVGQQLTPAGVALTQAIDPATGLPLFSSTQLVSLGATVLNGTPLANGGTVNNDGFFNSDLRLSWIWKVKESIRVEPMVEVFNLFNIANYTALSAFLDGNPGNINGTTSSNRPTRVGSGSGSFAPGVQRAFQFAVRVTF